jgi:hypothetical protein
MARWLILAGLLLFAAGVVLRYAPGLLSWFGRLPGDIRIDSASGKIFIPVTSMLVVSVVLSLLITFLRR